MKGEGIEGETKLRGGGNLRRDGIQKLSRNMDGRTDRLMEGSFICLDIQGIIKGPGGLGALLPFTDKIYKQQIRGLF